MKVTLLLLMVASVNIWPAAAFADDVKTPVGEAQAFLNEVRVGRLPADAEVILNANGGRSYLTKDEARKILESCREGAMRWTAIPNRDGTVDPHEKTVETRFSCDGDFANYAGSAGVILSKDDTIIRLIIQADGYAEHFTKKQK